MLKSNHSPISPPSGVQYTINELVCFDPILDEYFRNNAILERYWNLAHDLMLDGIRYRAEQGINTHQNGKEKETEFDNNREAEKSATIKIENKVELKKNNVERDFVRENSSPNMKHVKSSDHLKYQSPKNNHYNVEYVKHKRFLSPKQRKEALTPKVTEIIPVSSPQIVYGKPRVRVDDDFGCPYHENAEECLRSIPYGGPCEPCTPIELKNTQYEVHIKENPAFEAMKRSNFNSNFHENEFLRYDSAPNINRNTEAQVQRETPARSNQRVQNDYQEEKIHLDYLKTKNNKNSRSKSKQQNENHKSSKHSKNRKENSETEQTIYVERILEVESRFPGKVKVVNSPKSRAYENESEEESYLISRYEGNKQKGHGKEIESKIKFLVKRDKKNKALEKNMKKQEQRIQELEEMIKNPNKSEKQKNIIEIVSNDILSLSESSKSSEMSMMDSQQMKNYKKTLSKKQPRKEKRDSAAYFGTAELHHFHNQENTEILDCSCSKTFSEEGDLSKRDQTNSEFSQFV